MISEEMAEFYKPYGRPGCEICGGDGYEIFTDSEPWGDTFIDVPKGVDFCHLCRPNAGHVSFRYWSHFTRRSLVEADDIPF